MEVKANPRKCPPFKLIKSNLNKENKEKLLMAKLKSELEKMVTLQDKDYLDLVEDHIMMTALRIAGIEEMPIYKAAISILKNNHVEVHIKPIKHYYR